MATFEYPQVGFHFSVFFQLDPQFENDGRFQEVSGLNAEIISKEVKEGGDMEKIKYVPCSVKYSDLTLKRGKFLGSGVIHWFNQVLENINQGTLGQVPTTNIMVSLLDEAHEPVYSWFIQNARPKKLSISAFNAEQNNIVIEEMTFTYERYTYYDAITSDLGNLSIS